MKLNNSMRLVISSIITVLFFIMVIGCNNNDDTNRKKTKESIPVHTIDDFEQVDYFGQTIHFTRHTTTANFIDLIKSNWGDLADKENGFWYRTYYLMGFDKYDVPDEQDYWLDEYGYIVLVLPNGEYYFSDALFAVLIVYNLDDDSFKQSFFYGDYTMDDLTDYLRQHGTDEVRSYFDMWYTQY